MAKRNMPATWTQATGSKSENAPAILAAATKKPIWENGEKTDKMAWVVTIACPANQFSTIEVKLPPEADIPVTPEAIDAANADNNFVGVVFDGFSATVYADRDGNLHVSAKAKGMRVVEEEE